MGWLFSMQRSLARREAIALTVGLGLFFVANFSMMNSATKLVVAANEELQARAAHVSFAGGALKSLLAMDLLPGRLPASYALHGLVDAAVIFAVWGRTRAR